MAGHSIPAVDTRPQTLVDFAYETLRDDIISGRLKPGAPIKLRDSAERLGTSQIPVREALQRLEQAGLIRMTPRHGARVSQVSMADLEDTYATRMLIEERAIRLAARSFRTSDGERATALLNDLARASTNAQRHDTHAAFHLALFQPAESAWIARLVPQLWATSERYMNLSLANRGPIGERIEEHRHLLERCMMRDEDGAAAALLEHINRALESVRGRLQSKAPSSLSPSFEDGPATSLASR